MALEDLALLAGGLWLLTAKPAAPPPTSQVQAPAPAIVSVPSIPESKTAYSIGVDVPFHIGPDISPDLSQHVLALIGPENKVVGEIIGAPNDQFLNYIGTDGHPFNNYTDTIAGLKTNPFVRYDPVGNRFLFGNLNTQVILF